MLGLLGVRCHLVTSGEEALTFLQDHQVDLVWANIIMPGMNGLELIARVRDRWAQLPIVVLTGSAAQLPEGVPGPAIPVFRKPVAPSAVVEMLRVALPHDPRAHALAWSGT